ncbi:MAG: lipocalin-like domain-containing protein [Prevotella sp.]
MKRNFIKLALICLTTFSTQSAGAQTDLGNILNNVLGGNNSTSDVVSGLTSIFSSSKQATEKTIIGTWVYEEPAIVLQSDNVLTSAAAKLAAKKAETKLQEQLNKIGIKKGALTLTFNGDGTFSETFGSKSVSGTWSIKNSKLIMKHTVRSTTLTTQVSGKELMFVTDASKLLKLFQTLGSNSTNSSISTVTSLMKKVKGMQCGITLVKK